ncbi:acetyltransferase NDAI_0C05700 [Naumovozyma dairenensis CBS 421]|uniref:Maltose/galactoside acetyltransferase domain-containing protein n=1 Tax=Naumovozyma dairenensis (strain ATCC 10597 / BCRC 20456 / CBS 421 / NBRC 0211 / NRRL Y-12639) TaxID=1071378 RepID=G0W8W8_NAUDC|nr:hypothetical protein NDAI_0C05700 [Naumovozyma dairenensis CBS 421]CCD24229.1 hypothetical protein NDAI_0C05700 [Naumovozyma dairenensis CBS 421]
MNLKEYLAILETGKTVEPDSEAYAFMHKVSQEAIKVTMEMNNKYHEPSELRQLFSKLIGKEVDESFGLFPPFYSDCGKRITVGKNVFINAGCKFQDQGGITIGDGCLIGHNAVLATINHGLDPAKRQSLNLAPIVLEENVWLGANVTIIPGVHIGKNSVVSAGAVVTKDVPANSIVVGVPARVIKTLDGASNDEKNTLMNN